MGVVVTGGGRGVGRAVASLLAAAGTTVVVIERDPFDAGEGIVPVLGDASDPAVAVRAAELAAPLTGWVNNAAIFDDAWLHRDGAERVGDLITRNLAPALVGCHTAIDAFLADDTPGSIVNVSSHQAQRPVRGASAYATAKAAVEGLTRALAVDYGPRGIRVNAVALGSIATERSNSLSPEEAAEFEEEIRLLQPLGRMGRVDEVASAVAFLLSDAASFINGVILPIDGGRSAVGRDPEEADPWERDPVG